MTTLNVAGATTMTGGVSGVLNIYPLSNSAAPYIKFSTYNSTTADLYLYSASSTNAYIGVSATGLYIATDQATPITFQPNRFGNMYSILLLIAL